MHNTDYIPGLLKYKSDPLFYFAGKADMEQNYPARMQVYFPVINSNSEFAVFPPNTEEYV